MITSLKGSDIGVITVSELHVLLHIIYVILDSAESRGW